MSRPQHYFDWEQLAGHEVDEPASGTRERLRWVLALFGAALAVIFARAVQLEVSDGPTYRAVAVRPLERTVVLKAARGAILARDGTVLAADRTATALAMDFRYLQQPPDPQWLRALARKRLARADRRKPERVAAMEESARGDLVALHERLAKLCGLSHAQWQARTGRIERRVAHLAASVNRRRLDRFDERSAEPAAGVEGSLAAIVAGLFAPPERLPPPPVVLAEQRAFHRVVTDVEPEVIAEIQGHPQSYPGVKIVEFTRREYPLASLAAHWVGHVGAGESDDKAVGLMGIERRFETLLAGRDGLETQHRDHRGKLLDTHRQREPLSGGDVVLSIDSRLQLGAEQLLDRASRRLERGENIAELHGGAIAVLDVHSGEVLAAASAPRFEPNWFATGDPRAVTALHDPRRPMFDRVAKMALPPGSVFKPLVALALISKGTVKPDEPFHCQGYLNEPDRLRCQIFRRDGIGHGDVTLSDALAQSCNVYFFHHGGELGGAALVDFAGRCGFGRPTGLDLSDEAAGHLPTINQLHESGQTHGLAIGQGALTVTPLQIARFYAAIANGGYLLTPRLTVERPASSLIARAGKRAAQPPEGTRIVGLSEGALGAVRDGLRCVVEDPNGTGYNSVRSPMVAIAGKTGTAETGSGGADHAWFAGYVPADAPRYALVVVIEHGGSGASTAGSLAKNLVEQMQRLGYFEQAKDEG